MRSRTLGRSGLTVSEIALGTMTWGSRTSAEEAETILRRFVAAGGNLIDTAHGYADGASEQIIGELLPDVGRDDLVIATKAGISRASGERVVDVSRRALLRQLDSSLSRLGTDHVDVWLAHTWSDAVPLEETLDALATAHRSGKARYVGVSNYAGWQLARAVSLLERDGIPVIADQVEFSLLARSAEHEIAPAAAALGVGLLAWSPLGRGILTGKYRDGTPADSRAAAPGFAANVAARLGEDSARIVDALRTAARGLECTPAHVALAWALGRPSVSSVISGVRTDGQLRQLLDGADLSLPTQIVEALDEVSSTSL